MQTGPFRLPRHNGSQKSLVTRDTDHAQLQIPSEGNFVGLDSQGNKVTYTMAPMVWEIEYLDIIPKQSFTGTVEQLRAHKLP